MTTTFWFYLGGVVGWAALVASNDDLARAFKRAVHHGGWRAVGGQLIGLVLWPLTSAIALLFGQAFVRYLDKRDRTQAIRVRCPVCELEDEVRVTQGRWRQEPGSWLRDAEGVLFCSYRCAKHFAEHHEGKNAK